MPASRVADLLESLALSPLDYTHLQPFLEQFSAELEPFSLAPLLPAINHCFGSFEIREIRDRLDQTAQGADKPAAHWAAEQIRTLSAMSPTAVVATLELLRRGRSASLKRCLNTEYGLARSFLKHVPDMEEGVMGRLVRKQQQISWNPPSLGALLSSSSSSPIERLFNPDSALEFLTPKDYEQYPHRDNALPTVERIRQMVERDRNVPDWRAIVQRVCQEQHYKLGLREKLESTMAAHVRTRQQLENLGHVAVSSLTWTD